MSGSTWVILQIIGSMIMFALTYMIIDTYRPVAREIEPTQVLTPLERGKGFTIRYHIERLRECPGSVMHYAIGQGPDGLNYPLSRQPIPAFRRTSDKPMFSMSPYLPAYVVPGAYVIRTVAEYHCTGLVAQLMVMDSQLVQVP